ncbi:MAG: hypothetical protein IBJ11_04815 [Phycisphaerales bacterium]|nr:hypothetical protein [Phycisphaerales bacterium]
MALIIGVAIAMATAAFGRLVGFERDRAFYATVLAVLATYYGLFAVMGGSTRAILIESSVIAVFLSLSALGFRTSQWLIVAGLAGHGVFDLLHGHFIANPGVPEWWPQFCLGYDVAAAAYLAWLIMARRARN